LNSSPRSTSPWIAAALAVSAVAVSGPGRADGGGSLSPLSHLSPLSGVIRAKGIPVPRATLIVKRFVNGVETIIQVVKVGADGSFVLPRAAAGVYTLVSFAPGFRPAIVRVLHQGRADAVSFFPLELERGSGVLPNARTGEGDPFLARALTRGDVLREADSVLASPEPLRGALSPFPGNASTMVASALPVRASLSSMTGFGTASGASRSKTSVDVSGLLGESFRWGVEGQYSRASYLDSGAGDASKFAVDVDPGGNQRIRLSTRRQKFSVDQEEDGRFTSHGLYWSGSTGGESQASVSARVSSQSRFLKSGPAPELFARDSNDIDVTARYRTGFSDGHFVRVTAGYRSMTGTSPTASAAATSTELDREARVGGSAGFRILDAIVVEGGATGDFADRARGITPEISLALDSADGWRAFVSASRRYELTSERPFDEHAFATAGIDTADLSRLSRAFYRAGIRYQSPAGESAMVEVSSRQLAGTYRYLLEPDFLDRLDSLYFFSGDVAREISFQTTFAVQQGLVGRVSARAGDIRGQREGSIRQDDARYAIAEAALHVAWTRTSLGMGYRVVSQTLSRGDANLHNDLDAVDFSVAQALPIPRAFGSEWRALFSFEIGHRQEGLEALRSNRQLSGGLALSF